MDDDFDLSKIEQKNFIHQNIKSILKKCLMKKSIYKNTI